MDLRYSTACFPLRPYVTSHVTVKEVVDLFKISPIVELGFEIEDHYTDFEWFNNLLNTVDSLDFQPNVALHFNGVFSTKLVLGHEIPTVVQELLSRKNLKTNKPVIGRIKIHIGRGVAKIDPGKLSNLIYKYDDKDFIFPCNEYVVPQIEALMNENKNHQFKLLFDERDGWVDPNGVGFKSWLPKPWFDFEKYWYEPRDWWTHQKSFDSFGYGGACIKVNNVSENLNRISMVVPGARETWIESNPGFAKEYAKSAGDGIHCIKLPKPNEYGLANYKKYLQIASDWNKDKGFISGNCTRNGWQYSIEKCR